MKKYITIIMTIVLALCFNACSNQKQESKMEIIEEPQENAFVDFIDPNEPSNEEYEVLLQYSEIVNFLHHCDDTMDYAYQDNEGNFHAISGQETVKYMYEQLSQMEIVDKWIGTEICQSLDGWDDPSICWDRQELLSHFFVVKDVLLEQYFSSMDAVGNGGLVHITQYYYNKAGNLDRNYSGMYHGCHWIGFGWYPEAFFNDDVQNVYDENNVLIQTKCISGNQKDIQLLINPIYDNNGQRIGDTLVQDNGKTWTYYYAYNDNNQLISVSVEDELESDLPHYDWVCEYHYDSNGNIIKVSKTDGTNITRFVIEYEYNYENNTVTGTYLDAFNNEITESYCATLDNQGRILTWSTKTKYGTHSYERTYGDYFGFSLEG